MLNDVWASIAVAELVNHLFAKPGLITDSINSRESAFLYYVTDLGLYIEQ